MLSVKEACRYNDKLHNKFALSYYKHVASCTKMQLRGRQGKLLPRKRWTDPLVNWYNLWAFYEHRTYFFTSHNRHFQMERLLANFWIRLCVCFYINTKGPWFSLYVTFTAINQWQSQFQAYCCGLSTARALFRVPYCVSMKLKLHKHV